jgi:hypothetical protein
MRPLKQRAAMCELCPGTTRVQTPERQARSVDETNIDEREWITTDFEDPIEPE